MDTKAEIRKLLAPYLERSEEAINRTLSEYEGSIFYEPLKFAVSGGKRIRPALLYLSAEVAPQFHADPDPAAVCVELIHVASLIHDDLIDRDSVRRGRESFYVKYGLEKTILISDFILSIVLKLSSLYDDREVSRSLARATRLMSEGELQETLVLREGTKISLDRYLDILYKKTAVLFEESMRIGALIVKSEDTIIRLLSRIGMLTGLAYQIKDDLHDWGHKGEISKLLDVSNARETLTDKLKELVNEAKSLVGKLPSCSSTDKISSLLNFILVW